MQHYSHMLHDILFRVMFYFSEMLISLYGKYDNYCINDYFLFLSIHALVRHSVERQCTLKCILSVVSVGNCRPVCAQGCEPYGVCVAPDVCRCHFGYVGNNCSTECQCNRHSNCRGVDETDVCLQCRNHTQVGRGIFFALFSIFGALSFQSPRSPTVCFCLY